MVSAHESKHRSIEKNLRGATSHALKLRTKHIVRNFEGYQRSNSQRIKVYQRNIKHHKYSAEKTFAYYKAKSASKSKKLSKVKADGVSSGHFKGSSDLLSVNSDCGSANPSTEVTKSSGPNGRQEFFNCGITSGGWKPADVKMSMIKSVSLEAEPAKTTFASCREYFPLFEKYGKKHNIPPIFLASFAMQESSCNPHASGDNGGAYGLMQITKDKCGGAPGGDCSSPDYNVMMGAKTFADGLSSSNGNVLVALGAYNGWEKGLTKEKALQAKAQGCCECQQNLDYMQQFLNGWILGLNPYSKRLGMMRNLDSCQ
ncbi:lysozyme-like domain-containing protein [Phakopsora pachyrhizi]|uniref:Lysozyme-like domain-containing protein n=2 Tax=Phakopsora pachyrhizi TaxID=170000 RepID=A0AAV0BH95_PHAPC|nr:lysozyme-like domain-containing protein [Phakopsora pachyrhizi]CAH7685952.1 lysozyme-like domain-containing protein [Phakopsora pachyrhizi]